MLILLTLGVCAAPTAETGDPRRDGGSRQSVREGVLTTTQEEAIKAGDVAMGLLNEMLEAGIEPDVITYGCVCCLPS